MSKMWSINTIEYYSAFFFLFRVTLAGYGTSQTRDQIRAAAIAQVTATAKPEPSLICDLRPTACGNTGSTSKDPPNGDQTCILPETT